MAQIRKTGDFYSHCECFDVAAALRNEIKNLYARVDDLWSSVTLWHNLIAHNLVDRAEKLNGLGMNFRLYQYSGDHLYP